MQRGDGFDEAEVVGDAAFAARSTTVNRVPIDGRAVRYRCSEVHERAIVSPHGRDPLVHSSRDRC